MRLSRTIVSCCAALVAALALAAAPASARELAGCDELTVAGTTTQLCAVNLTVLAGAEQDPCAGFFYKSGPGRVVVEYPFTTVDWGDGTSSELFSTPLDDTNADPTEQCLSRTHAFAGPGVYPTTLVAETRAGTLTAHGSVTITAPPQLITADGVTGAGTTIAVDITGTSSTDFLGTASLTNARHGPVERRGDVTCVHIVGRVAVFGIADAAAPPVLVGGELRPLPREFAVEDRAVGGDRIVELPLTRAQLAAPLPPVGCNNAVPSAVRVVPFRSGGLTIAPLA